MGLERLILGASHAPYRREGGFQLTASPPQMDGTASGQRWLLLTCWGSWKCLSSPLGGHRGPAPLSAGQAVLEEGWTRSGPAGVCARARDRTPTDRVPFTTRCSFSRWLCSLPL